MEHSTPATLDELATLYLRARDTPCPKCDYNRRDGTTAACPECGTDIIASMESLPYALVLGPKRLRFIAISTAAIAIVTGLVNAGELWLLNNTTVYGPNGAPAIALWQAYGRTMTMLGIGIAAPFVAMFYIVRVLIESLRTRPTPSQTAHQGRRLNSAMLWLAVAIFVPGFDRIVMLLQII
jgi:hypothetical protein